MRVLEKLKSFEDKYPVGLLAIVLAIILTAIAVVLTLPPRASLAYRVLSDVSVVDVNQDVPRLSISYAGQPIHGRLRMVTLRIENDGTRSIAETDYSKTAPLGLEVTNGTMIDAPKIIDASDDTLARQVTPQLASVTTAHLGKIMLNAGDYLVITFLAVTDQDQTVEMRPTARIASVSEIPVTIEYSRKLPTILWRTARPLLLIMFAAAMYVLGALTSRRWVRLLLDLDDRRRGREHFKHVKRDIRSYLRDKGQERCDVHDWLEREAYYGEGFLMFMQEVVNDRERLQGILQQIESGDRTVEHVIHDPPDRDEPARPGRHGVQIVLDHSGLGDPTTRGCHWVGLRGIVRGLDQGLSLDEMGDVLNDFLRYYHTHIDPRAEERDAQSGPTDS